MKKHAYQKSLASQTNFTNINIAGLEVILEKSKTNTQKNEIV